MQERREDPSPPSGPRDGEEDVGRDGGIVGRREVVAGVSAFIAGLLARPVSAGAKEDEGTDDSLRLGTSNVADGPTDLRRTSDDSDEPRDQSDSGQGLGVRSDAGVGLLGTVPLPGVVPVTTSTVGVAGSVGPAAPDLVDIRSVAGVMGTVSDAAAMSWTYWAGSGEGPTAGVIGIGHVTTLPDLPAEARLGVWGVAGPGRDAVGIRAEHAGEGLALDVAGRARFQTAGHAVVPARKNSVFVRAAVTATSHVMVTLAGSPGNRSQVHWVEPRAGGFLVALTTPVVRDTPLSFLAVETNPSDRGE